MGWQPTGTPPKPKPPRANVVEFELSDMEVEVVVEKSESMDVAKAKTATEELKWIPCSRAMPTAIDTYIVCGKMKYDFESEYEYFVDAAEYDPYDSEFSTWNDWYEGQDEYEILAWMPLPEPWKEGENDAD